MSEKIVRREDLIPATEPGSFLELILAPGYYTYARKLDGLSGFAFYDILTTESLVNLSVIEQREVLLMAPLLMPESSKWTVIGYLPLIAGWPGVMYYWRAKPRPLIDEKSQQLIFSHNTKFFLVDSRNHEPLYIPASLDSLRGLPRQTLYPPEIIEERLRLHFGLTPEGQQIEPLALSQQPLL